MSGDNQDVLNANLMVNSQCVQAVSIFGGRSSSQETMQVPGILADAGLDGRVELSISLMIDRPVPLSCCYDTTLTRTRRLRLLVFCSSCVASRRNA